MSSTMRWRYGDTNPILIPVLEATVVEIGDLVYLDTDNALPASAQGDQGTAAANQQLFHDVFAGIAMQASPDGDSRDIRVATTGVFEFDCAAATFEVGDLIGAVEDAGGTMVEDQSVVGVVNASEAIGRCAKRVNPAASRVLVDIVSTISHGGPQEPA